MDWEPEISPAYQNFDFFFMSNILSKIHNNVPKLPAWATIRMDFVFGLLLAPISFTMQNGNAKRKYTSVALMRYNKYCAIAQYF